jgi:cytochrome c oxidase assembly protein subunit 15
MTPRPRPSGTYRAACFLVGSIFFLITLGGQVTTKVAGMAVPDWPGTFGHNMFTFPWARMTACALVFLEHSHRLVAAGVGLITLGVMAWVWSTTQDRWAKGLSLAAAILVVVQGVVGGQRVIQVSWVLGMTHACLAQIYLAVAGSLALVLSRFWTRPVRSDDLSKARMRMVWALTGVVFLQTILGAFMRHDGPGFLSVPDFPKIYGEWLPAFWQADVLQGINTYRATELQWPVTSTSLIAWQLLHRTLGILAALGIFVGAVWSVRPSSTPAWWRRGVIAWAALAGAQVFLGILTIWSGRLPEIATLHVLFGAGLTLTGWLLGFASWRSVQTFRAWEPVTLEAHISVR